MRIARFLAGMGIAGICSFFPAAALAAPCAGFVDVEDTSPFCASVEWIRNRQITLGCTATQYCPDQPVTRLQMAAFLKRVERLTGPLLVDSGGRPFAVATLHDNTVTAEWSVVVLPRFGPDAFALRLNAPQDRLFYFNSATVYHSEPNCNTSLGTQYINFNATVLFSPRVAVVVFGSSQGVAGPRIVYASVASHGLPSPFGSTPYQSSYANGVCDTSPGSAQNLVPAVRIVDLAATWTEPFHLE